MKKGLFIVIALVMLLGASSGLANADGGGLYLAAKAGAGFMRGDKSMSNNQTALTGEDTSWKSSILTYGGAIGWNWLDQGAPIRTEVEFYDHGSLKMTHKDSNATFSTTTDVQTLQLNFYYDFYNDTNFIPYLGAGVGVANLKSGGSSKQSVSYSLFGGAAYKLSESLLLDMTYRISQFGDTKQSTWSDTNSSYDVKIKNLYSVTGTLGLRYQF